jgi:hypothetical protein
VEPWVPEPIIEIDTSLGGGEVFVAIDGYTSVPMGRIEVNDGAAAGTHSIGFKGGVIAGSYEVPDTARIGYSPDYVLQRKIRLTSTAGRSTSVALVQVNESGYFGVNSWSTQ